MKRIAGSILVCTALVTSACSSNGTDLETPAAGPTGPSGLDAGTIGNVKVTRVRVFIRDGQPQAFLQGEVGDGCNTLQPVAQQRSGSSVDIAVTYRRQGDICTMIMQFLNQWVPLNGTFAPGEYVVRANDQTLRFRLVSSNGGLRVDPDPGPPPQPPYLPNR
jgi:hypothetical protein